jgi:hypothetical protein
MTESKIILAQYLPLTDNCLNAFAVTRGRAINALGAGSWYFQ